MTDAEKALTRRVPMEAFNEGKLEAIDEALAPDFIENQATPGFPPGGEGLKAFVVELRRTFPDFKYTLNKEIAEGDTLMQYLTATGTMTGDFMGMKASGKMATWNEIHIVRMQNGKGAEHWGVADELAMLQQLGFIPTPEEMAKAA
jgi:predicted ester cyclase